MAIALIRKLEQFTRLSAEDKQVLTEITGRGRVFQPREDLVQEGDKPSQINVILSGWACRYKQLEDGRRSITGFMVPGDLCDQNIFILRQMDHSLGAITLVTVAEIPRAAFEELTLKHSRITQALWWATLVEIAIQREWTVNLGQRSAFERMAHLLCELYLRLQGVGLTRENSCEIPVTQAELADATGLTAVHVNRTLQDLRAVGLIALKGKTLTIPNLEALMQASLFNPNYLHLDREGRHLNANDINGVPSTIPGREAPL
ncbi:Crp/Fnr family transcriptional regulator [Microvirga rosea]|uniref:Crp/Fnr family transcriptional regulator n=1 Tax=Microvirga rosea TaxID=2715425 RepID=UPI001D0B024C|nr:Crp/Fnr family transcriptional regulator [Microvirga rosea]MCB8822870.1 Crp/Fnr family transcriptional regulator [Microvirga rosea]